MPSDDLPLLIREVYAAAAGGLVDEWAEFDAVFAEERQCAVLVCPARIYSNSDE